MEKPAGIAQQDPVQAVEAACRSCLSSIGAARGDRVLVGFSGGPDSTALAHALSGMRREGGFFLEMAYVDHGIRPREELDEEIRVVRAFSRSIDCPVRVIELGTGRVKEMAARTKRGIEATARELRLEALAAAIPSGTRAFLALGHNRDDQYETMIMRFFSGSGIRGLRGMPDRGRAQAKGSLTIIRPLLSVGKEEIYGYLKAHGLGWSIDSSNQADDYLRNRVRRRLIPAVSANFPGYGKSLSALRRKLILLESYMDQSAKGLFILKGEAWVADAEAFFASHAAIRLHALENAVAQLSSGGRIPFRLLETMALAERRDGASARGILASGCGIRLRSDGKSVILEKHLVQGSKKGYFFIVRGPGSLGPFDGAFFALYPCKDPKAGPALSSLSFPLALRSARPMDRLRCAGGSKLLSDIMREWGADAGIRQVMPVLEDGQGLVCVFGGPYGFKNRFAERGFVPGGGEEQYLGLKVVEKGGMNGSE